MSANRPLSPHLQVYRLPLTGLVSITHRMTGVFLSMGLVLFVYVLFAIAAGEDVYTSMQAFMSFWLFKLVYWGFIYALFFHLVHGIRHLIWDVGKTFDRTTLDKFAVYELAASASLTLITFIVS
jgi:succinate dehydrogenase / fumarate reductase cytochrome b subunit